jgi:hypothetical protein
MQSDACISYADKHSASKNVSYKNKNKIKFNPLNAGLNLICHLLALLRAHPIFHIGRIKANVLLTAHPCIIL